jgi:hypothetical protein
MRLLVALSFLVASAASASAQYIQTQPLGGGYGTGSNPNSHYAQPYTTHNGTNVQGHYQTNPNNTQLDNYGTRPNMNPYTGPIGTRSPRW